MNFPTDQPIPTVATTESTTKEEMPLDWTSSVMTMDEWQRRFGAKFGDARNAISENVSAKPAPAKTGKVSILPVITRLDIPAERVLNGALDADLTGCFVVGVNPDGELYFASSFADGGTVLWWMAMAKKALLQAAS